MRELGKDERKYRDILIDLVGTGGQNGFQFLLEILWNKEFYSLIPHDENRAEDGKQLRKEVGFDDDFGPCRCLEMLISLSKRAEFLLHGYEFASNFVDIFWEIICNLGLNKYDKKAFTSSKTVFEVEEILDKWIERRYSFDGNGGLFPINGAEMDQKEVEIWYQMQKYLIDKKAKKGAFAPFLKNYSELLYYNK